MSYKRKAGTDGYGGDYVDSDEEALTARHEIVQPWHVKHSKSKVVASQPPPTTYLTTRPSRQLFNQTLPPQGNNTFHDDPDDFDPRNAKDDDYEDELDEDGDRSTSTGLFIAPSAARRSNRQGPAAAPSKSTSRRRTRAVAETSEDQGNITSSPPVHLSKAHELKLQLKDGLHIFNGGSRKRLPEHDPENYEIKRMRTEERMSWGDIARILNERRIAAGKSPSLTEAAVYGRFVRNGPRIAQANGEDFNPSDHMHLKNTKTVEHQVVAHPRFTTRQDEMLVQAYAEIQGQFWENVAIRLDELCGKRFSAEACAKRYHCI